MTPMAPTRRQVHPEGIIIYGLRRRPQSLCVVKRTLSLKYSVSSVKFYRPPAANPKTRRLLPKPSDPDRLDLYIRILGLLVL